ncbi:MAG: hypothetical protein AAFS10_08710 [Myxococcota bacterium]
MNQTPHYRTRILLALVWSAAAVGAATQLTGCSASDWDRIIGKLVEVLLVIIAIALIVALISMVLLLLEIALIVVNFVRPSPITAMTAMVVGGAQLMLSVFGAMTWVVNLWSAPMVEMTGSEMAQMILMSLVSLTIAVLFSGLLAYSGWQGWQTVRSSSALTAADGNPS